MNKLKWDEGQRGLTVFVDEGKGWVLYTSSKLKLPGNKLFENPAFGFFQIALEAGYTVLDRQDNEI